MDAPHFTNIAIHVLAGTAGLLIGLMILLRPKGTAQHRRWGRWFGYMGLVVVVTAGIGSVLFRFIPVFAVLTVVVLYQLISGWRVIYTKASGPQVIDGVWTLLGFAASAVLVPVLLRSADVNSAAVMNATLGGLGMLLVYDTVRWLFPRRWHAVVWPYEHIYKMAGSFFGMLSALVGNVIRFGQPWSQVLPSALGFLVIIWFFVRQGQGKLIKNRPVESGSG